METILLSGQRNILNAIKQTNDISARTQRALASGRDVNSALDAPNNFFSSKALMSQASGLTKTLDGMGTSIRTIQEANNGIEAQLKLLDQAEAMVSEGLRELFPRTDEVPDPEAIQYIIDQNPGRQYFAETNNFYENTTDFATWNEASDRAGQAELSGVPELRGHLATITSQAENDFVFNNLTSSSWLGGSDDAVEGEWRWVEGPEEGEQFWQGLVAGNAVNGAYTNWAPGEPNQFFGPGNPENYAHMRADGLWNDLPASQNLNYIIEWGGDLLIQNPDINVSTEAMDYRREYTRIIEQLGTIALDSDYRGVNLLDSNDLDTSFNRDDTSSLETQGVDASVLGLGLTNDNFISKTEMSKIIGEIQDARKILRGYSRSLQNDLSIITSRQDFTERNINTYEAGADDLTIADLNEKGSDILALQTRQQLQIEALSLASSTSILDLFS